MWGGCAGSAAPPPILTLRGALRSLITNLLESLLSIATDAGPGRLPCLLCACSVMEEARVPPFHFSLHLRPLLQSDTMTEPGPTLARLGTLNPSRFT